MPHVSSPTQAVIVKDDVFYDNYATRCGLLSCYLK